MTGLPFCRFYDLLFDFNAPADKWELAIPAKATLCRVVIVAVNGSGATVTNEAFTADLLSDYSSSYATETGSAVVHRIINTLTGTNGIATYTSYSVPMVNTSTVAKGDQREHKIYLTAADLSNSVAGLKVQLAGFTPVL